MDLLGYNESWYNSIPTRKRAQYRVYLRQDTGQVGLWVVDGQRWGVKPRMDLFECHVDGGGFDEYCNEQRTRRGLVWGIAVAISVMKGVEYEGEGRNVRDVQVIVPHSVCWMLKLNVETLKSELKVLKS